VTLKDFYADRIIDFLKKYAPYVFERANKKIIRQHILQHMEYGTIVVLWNQSEIVGVCAFNIVGEEAQIIDCVVHPQYRYRRILQRMTQESLLRHPYVKSLTFQRWAKHRNDKQHKILIDRLLRESSQNVLA